MDWKKEFDRVMADPATHFWVKEILTQASPRRHDP